MRSIKTKSIKAGKREALFCLAKEHAHQMIAHALSQAPQECCGILAGAEGKVVKVYTATNIEKSPVRYNIDPSEILRVYKDIEEKGWELLGVYHSHTHTEAYPSPTDIQLAFWTDSLYFIISLQNPGQPVIRAFQIVDKKIKELPLKIL